MKTEETEAKRGARIVGLKVQNVLRIKAVEIYPGDAPVVTISGKNDQGKTSLVESIFMGMRGAKKIPKDALRHGATKGLIELDLGDIKSKLELRKGKTPKLTVFGADGEKLKRPQEILDNLCGKQSLDARRFSAISGAERIETVNGLTGLDFTKHDTERSGVYEKRKDANSEVRRITGALDSTTHHDGVPDAVVSVAKLSSELQVAAEGNAANARKRETLEAARAAAMAHSAEIERLRKALADADAALDDMKRSGAALAAEVKALSDVDTEALNAQIVAAEETNDKVRANAEYVKLTVELSAAKAKSEKLTDHIEAMDEVKADAIAKADYPVEGLTVGDDDVRLGDCDFAQAGGARRLVAGAAIDLALHPDLDTVCLDECGNLDDESRTAIAKWARDEGKQLICLVAGEEPGTVIIEDGMVKDVSGE